MKILQTVQAYYPFQEKGGPVVKVRAIALGLAQSGHQIAILTADWGLDPAMVPAMTVTKCRWGWCAEESGVNITFLRNAAHYRALSWNPNAISFCREQLQNYDLAHVYGLYDLLGPTVTFFCRRYRIPYVVEPMGMFRPIVRNIGLKKAYHRLFGKHLLDGARQLIATSDQEKRELVEGEVDSRRIIIRRNGVEGPNSVPRHGAFRAEWEIPPGTRLVLFLGRIEPKKSPDLLIEAFAQWREGSPCGAAAVLAVCGPEQDPRYSAHLRSLVASLRMEDAVRFTGPLYDEHKWNAYCDADAFVLPSQNENFGNSAAEAMVCGTPVIVTDQCGIAPIVAGRAGLVVSHDAASIAAALRIMLEDSSAAQRFRNACPTVVSELSWKEPIAQMSEIYREALPKAS